MTPKPQAVLGIAGWKNSGKTTLTERLIAELVARGFTISTIKHAHHDAEIDLPGTDTHRHRTAGAKEVLLTTGNRFALIHELQGADEPPFEELLAKLAPASLVLVEGFKRVEIPKIEVRRLEARSREPLHPDDLNVFAIAADHAVTDATIPVFGLNVITEIAGLITRRFGLVPR